MMAVIKIIGAVLALWAAAAGLLQLRRGVSFHQAALYAPLKILFRVSDRAMAGARTARPPVIYAIWHRSRMEPALMLSLLPDDTLHILDHDSAHSPWLEAWRAMARTIAFNAEHVFVSRRLVRRLKGNGRLAVYIPDETDPDPKAFRLFRAVARIARKAEAQVIPIYVAPGGLVPGRRITALAPATIDSLIAAAEDENVRASQALFDYMAKARESARPD